MSENKKKKIWIDLDNTPHVPFFKPIIEKLEQNGIEVFITARDRFQVCELADLHGLQYRKMGHLHGKNTIFKVSAILFRALQSIPVLLKEKPDLAIAHGSRSLLISAKLLNIPSVDIFDYEHASHVPFFSPKWIIIPQAITEELVNFDKDHTFRYPGIKEDVYACKFKPNNNIIDELGIDKRKIIILVRPPAVEAHYHKHLGEELFESVLNLIINRNDTQIILLPRNGKQTNDVKEKWKNYFSSGKISIPAKAVNGLDLIWHSDLVISGGGTMNREAAALKVPVYSIFGGKIGAVDKCLSQSKRLTFLRSIDDVHSKIVLRKRSLDQKLTGINSQALSKITGKIKTILEQL
ncbi:DUF354 domain-containing protein [candidate division KSB1 bacterium]|nr:DUF354 domain-containing protein [candidate division KSB1 bacterium]